MVTRYFLLCAAFPQVHAIREREDGGGSKTSGFLALLAKKIRDNLEIHIKNFRVNVADVRSPEDGRAYRLVHTHTKHTHTQRKHTQTHTLTYMFAYMHRL